jgi:branched-chain amino acid transport system ATP-binding protein
MLEVSNINVSIGETEILRSVSLRVHKGERVGIIGPNGHGKSTTLNTIAGLFKPKKGQISFEGRDIMGLAPRKIVECGVTLVPEGGHLFPEMSVMENLLLGAYTREATKHKKDSLEIVYSIFPKIKTLHKQKCNSLSGGELRMVAVGRGIMTYPKLLMLDEPTLGLAPNLVEDMGQKLYEIGELGTGVILADENIDLMSEFAKFVYFLENGEVNLSGETRQVLESEYIRKTYLGMDLSV